MRGAAGLVGGAMVVTLLGSCGGDGVRLLGDAMVDAAEHLRDAGELLDAGGDGAVADALAGDTGHDTGRGPAAIVAVDCDTEYTFRRDEDDPAGTYFEQTVFTAEAAIPAAAPDGSAVITAIACDREDYGTPSVPDGCGTGDTCTGSSVPPAIACLTIAGVEVEPGRVRLRCGHRIRTRDMPTPSGFRDSESGQRWRRVIFRVD